MTGLSDAPCRPLGLGYENYSYLVQQCPSANRIRPVEWAPHLGFRSHIKPIKFVDSAGKNLSQQSHGMQLATVG